MKTFPVSFALVSISAYVQPVKKNKVDNIDIIKKYFFINFLEAEFIS